MLQTEQRLRRHSEGNLLAALPDANRQGRLRRAEILDLEAGRIVQCRFGHVEGPFDDRPSENVDTISFLGLIQRNIAVKPVVGIPAGAAGPGDSDAAAFKTPPP